MTNISTTIHKKNITNFEKFIAESRAFGPIFNPPKANMTADQMTILLNKSKAADSAEVMALLALNAAQNTRADSMIKAPDTVTRSANIVRVIDAPVSVKEDLLDLAHKFLGRSKVVNKEVPTKTADGKTTVTTKAYSAGAQDMDSKIGYFDTYIKLLSTLKTYTPNEATLKIDALTIVLNDLKAKRTAEIAAEAAHHSAVIARNDIMYAPTVGILDVVKDVKAYVKAVFGTQSPQYKTMTALEFKKA